MDIIRVGIDLAKSVFQVHGVDRSEKAVWWRRKLARAEWLDVLQRTVPLHVAQLRDVINVVKPTPVAINVSLSTAMGCPMEGDIAKEEVLGWMRRFAELGVHGVTLCEALVQTETVMG